MFERLRMSLTTALLAISVTFAPRSVEEWRSDPRFGVFNVLAVGEPTPSIAYRAGRHLLSPR